MNNSINSTSPNFGAKINLEDVAHRFKNPNKVKAAFEKATEKYPNDIVDLYDHGDGSLSIVLTQTKEWQEKSLDLMPEGFKDLMKCPVKTFVNKMKKLTEVLEFGANRDNEARKLIGELIEKGHIEEGSELQDKLFDSSWESTVEMMKKMLDKRGEKVLKDVKVD